LLVLTSAINFKTYNKSEQDQPPKGIVLEVLSIHELLAVLYSIFGLFIGSFLNVVIYRVPLGKSLIRPGSHCPQCESSIAPFDNIPVLSWIILKGHCRNCHASIAVTYPLVELFTAGMFYLIAVAVTPQPLALLYCILVASLLALAVVEIETNSIDARLLWSSLLFGWGGLLVTTTVDHSWHKALFWLGGATFYALASVAWNAIASKLSKRNRALEHGISTNYILLITLGGAFIGLLGLISYAAGSLIAVTTFIVVARIRKGGRGGPLSVFPSCLELSLQ
jgi:leader peptidase (prepilin peptidase)/N-methyltransferase